MEMIINGTTLNSAELMTIRVALESFWSSLEAEGLGDGGQEIVQAYLNNIQELRKIIYNP